MRVLRRLAIVSTLMAIFMVPVHGATVFNFPNFNDCTTLQINGDAACTGGALRVTPANFGQQGSAFSTTLIPLGSSASFSTFFSFRITGSGGSSDDDGLGADGIVFVIQPVASTVGGGGGGIGYAGISPSLGVEFDTWNNGSSAGDPDGNHVGIDLNGSMVSVQTASIATRLNNGNVWYAWIDYNGAMIELRLSQVAARPVAPTLSYAVNLASVLGTTSAYVGFTSGTGAAYGNHDILTWQFENAFAPIGGVAASVSDVPTLSDVALILLACVLAGLAVVQMRRRHA